MELLLSGVALVACAGVAIQAAVARSRTEQRLGRQLSVLAARLSADSSGPAADPADDRMEGPTEGPTDLHRALSGLDRAASVALHRVETAKRLAGALAGVLGEVPLGVVVSGPDGEVLFRNSAADRLLGTRAADALALRAVTDMLGEAAAGRSTTTPLELFGPPQRTLSLSAIPVPGAAAVVVVDVSDRRRLEAVRKDFVANVSHELKTPVAALGLLAETLGAEDDPEVVHRLAERMQAEAFRVARIIEDLLDLSRLEAEETDRHEPVGLQSVLRGAVELVLPPAAVRSVGLIVPEVPASWTVLGEYRQLVSALANLLENAVKYSDPGSEVEVRAETDGSEFRLSVRDRGIGIPSRDLDRIFERFYRVDRGRGRDTGGTGLGLSIVRHVASNHGGDVFVESVEGEGSCFTLRLPAQPGPVGIVADAG